MIRSNLKNKRQLCKSRCGGFTLIEALIYLFLFTMIMVGNLSLSYSLLESNQKLGEMATDSQDIDFILGKINWLLGDFKEIILPNNEGSSNVLSLVRQSGDKYSIKEENGLLLMKINDGSFLPLHSSDIKVSDLIFEKEKIGEFGDIFLINASFSVNNQSFSVSKFNYVY